MFRLCIGLLILLVSVILGVPGASANSSEVTVAGRISPLTTSGLVVQAVSNDTLLSEQWYLDRLNVFRAWDITTGSGTTVAVIDTGANLTHIDLRGQYWVNTDEIPDNGRDDDANGFVDDVHGYNFADDDTNLVDEHGHGTGVASIIAGHANNGTGIAGISWQTKIMVIKSLNQDGGGDFSDVIEGIHYAVDNGAKIINMSFGSPSTHSDLRQAISYALNRGVIVVAASGNASDDEVYYPAAYTGVIAVGATDRRDRRSDFSNYGSDLDVSAPGEDITMAGLGTRDYFTGSGSSFAAAQISGLVNLLLGRYPQLTVTQVDRLLKDAGHLQDSGPTSQLGYGIPDAYDLVSTVSAPITANFTASPASVTANGTDRTSITATLLSGGQPLVNTPVVLTVTGTNNIVNGNLLSANQELRIGSTNNLGQLQFWLSSTTPEIKTFSLIPTGSGTPGAATGTVEFRSPAPGGYQVAWVNQSAYPTLGVGDTATLWLEVRNTGRIAWVASTDTPDAYGQLKLGTDRSLDRASVFATSTRWLSSNRPALMTPQIVRPGEIARFEFVATAVSPGQFREYFRPVVEHVGWLNDLGIYWDIAVTGDGITDAVATQGYQAGLVSQSDDLSLAPGTVGLVTVELRNTGQATWRGIGGDYGLVKVATATPRDRISPLRSTSWPSANRVMPLGFDVEPNQAITLTFSLLAPATAGTYIEKFSLVSEHITWFGPEFGWTVQVRPS